MRHFIVMGVSGCGKSTVGEAMALALGTKYIEGDDLHPQENIDKMSAGLALKDTDRWPWLDELARTISKEQKSCIAGCSALKRVYRDRLRAHNGEIVFVYLKGSRSLIEGRMAQRAGHFMQLQLLDSQFSTLEEPALDEASIEVDIDQNTDAIVQDILKKIGE